MCPALHPASSVANLRPNNQAQTEQTKIQCANDVAERGVFTVTCPAVASAAQGDFFLVNNRAGEALVGWLDIDADGTVPNGAGFVASSHQVEVDVVTGDTAAQVAAKVKAALEASGFFDMFTIVDNGNGTLTMTEDSTGVLVAGAPFDEPETGAGSFLVAETNPGVDSALLDKYINLLDDAGNKFHVWFNWQSQGADPAPADSTAIEVALSGGETSAQIAALVKAAIDAEAEFEANLIGTDAVQVRLRDSGNPTNASDGDTGFTVTTIRSGIAAQGVSPGDSPASLSNNPSAI